MAKTIVDKSADKVQGKAPGGFRSALARSSAKASAARPTQAPRGAVSAKPAGRIRTFFREVKVELTKVTWMQRKELLQATAAVIVAVVVTGIFVGVFDFVWNIIVKAVGLGG
jgi:preprotein translocase SecE subunit